MSSAIYARLQNIEKEMGEIKEQQEKILAQFESIDTLTEREAAEFMEIAHHTLQNYLCQGRFSETYFLTPNGKKKFLRSKLLIR